MVLSQNKIGSTRFYTLGLLALGMLGASLSYAQVTATNSPAIAPQLTNSSSAKSRDKTTPTLDEAAMLYDEGKSDEALSVVNGAIQGTPGSVNAYILRGAIYSQKKSWDLAEKDYQTAQQLDPKNDGIRYDLADLKFKQKQFDAAREAFVPIQDHLDSEVKDLVKYKIFLCDLFGGHDGAASKELDIFNQAGSNPSYYFGNAAWNLVQKKPDEAKGWLVSASHIYSMHKQLLYTNILKDMGYLPLPPSSDAQ